jgi:triosephosphate isomerase
VEIAVCAPYPYLAQLLERPAGVMLGAQDVSEYEAGAYTGEVSAAMLAEFGCRYVIVGHSERRALFGEDDLSVGRKARAALHA